MPVAKDSIEGEFSEVDDAAIAACNYLKQKHPDWVQYEYSGCIFRVDGSYKVSLPHTLYDPQFCVTPAAPAGTLFVASYHNHTTKEDFSTDPDLNTHSKSQVYLCTPKGLVKKYDPETKQITIVKGER